MTEIDKKKKYFRQKVKDSTLFMRLLRVNNLSPEEFKLVILLISLSNGTNCARISGLNLRAAGLHHRAVKETVVLEVVKKQIVLQMNKNTNKWIIENICRTCSLKYGSKECNNRAPIYYINKNHKTWMLKNKPKYNELLIEALLRDNGIEVPTEKISLNRQIEFQKEFDRKTEGERIADEIIAFDKERASIQKQNNASSPSS